MSNQLTFDSLYKENYSKVFRLCKGYFAGDTNTAQDVTQEVFIKVWEHLSTFKGESNISTWIYRIAVNTCLMTIRKNKKRNIFLNSDIPDLAQDEEQSTQEEQLKELYKHLETLHKEDKILMLMLLEGVPYKNISEVVGISEDSLRVRIHRVKKKVTKSISNGRI